MSLKRNKYLLFVLLEFAVVPYRMRYWHSAAGEAWLVSDVTR